MNNNNREIVMTGKNEVFVVILLVTTAMTYTLLLQYTNQLVIAQQLNQANNLGVNSISNKTNMSNATWSIGKVQNISIVPDASTLDDKSYQPNPINSRVGDTIIWTNTDNIPHTVTSGIEGADNAGMEFDSGFMDKNKTFEHKFTSKGDFPYYCQIHPNMIGEVIVY